MDRIYSVAAKEQQNQILQSILSELNSASSGKPLQREKILEILDDIPRENNLDSPEKSGWDFTREKNLPVLAFDQTVRIRPMTPNDCNFYAGIRKQYSAMPRMWENPELNRECFPKDTQKDNMLFCVIETAADKFPVGYIGLKDTSKDIWEIAIELDQDHCYQGIGTSSIRLFLSEIHRITGKEQFQSVVEVDNLPCQRCMEKLSAQLVGLCENKIFRTEEERLRFENENIERINEHIITLTKRLGVEPRTLLSHLLDYRIGVSPIE